MTFKTDLEKEASVIFQSTWEEGKRRSIPNPKDLSLGNDAVRLNATVLYADMADSTNLVDHHEHHFAAEIYKVYLRIAARIITNEQGSITAYDGDRIMAVFLGERKETLAVRSALKINYAVSEIINPSMKKVYPNKKYQLKHVVGVDTSELFVSRIGIKNDSDLVWVGRAANYAAKLCSLNGKHSTYITKAVFQAMDNSMKYGKDGSLVWSKDHWEKRNKMIIYGSTAWCRID